MLPAELPEAQLICSPDSALLRINEFDPAEPLLETDRLPAVLASDRVATDLVELCSLVVLEESPGSLIDPSCDDSWSEAT